MLTQLLTARWAAANQMAHSPTRPNGRINHGGIVGLTAHERPQTNRVDRFSSCSSIVTNQTVPQGSWPLPPSPPFLLISHLFPFPRISLSLPLHQFTISNYPLSCPVLWWLVRLLTLPLKPPYRSPLGILIFPSVHIPRPLRVPPSIHI